MSDVPVQLMIAAFQDENTAKKALAELKQAQREGRIRIENAAVLRKDEKGKLHIKETHDMGGGKGAVMGGVSGAAIGLIAGATLAAPVAVGALIGGLMARLRDSGFANRRLETFGESLQPGSSAIVAVVTHEWVGQVEQALAEARADILTSQISADVASQLEADHEAAYSLIASREGLVAGRLAGNMNDVEGGQLTVDESGVFASRFIATEKGFAVEHVVADETGISGTTIDSFQQDKKEKPTEELPNV